MNRLKTSLLAAALCFVVVAPLAAQDKTYTLQRKFTAGEMIKHKMSMNMDMKMKGEKGDLPFPGMTMLMSMTRVQKTKSVTPEGGAVVINETRNSTMEMMGNKQVMPPTKPITVTLDKAGKVLKMDNPNPKTGGMVGGLNPLQGMMDFERLSAMGTALPDKPVKVGDTWEIEIPAVPGMKAVKMVFTFEGVEMLNNQETLKIKQDMEMPLEMAMGQDGQPSKDVEKAMMQMTGKMNMSGYTYLNPESAQSLKSLLNFKAKIDITLQGAAATQSPFGSKMIMDMEGIVKEDLLSVGKISDDVAPVTKPAPKPLAKPAPKGKPTKKSGKRG